MSKLSQANIDRLQDQFNKISDEIKSFARQVKTDAIRNRYEEHETEAGITVDPSSFTAQERLLMEMFRCEIKQGDLDSRAILEQSLEIYKQSRWLSDPPTITEIIAASGRGPWIKKVHAKLDRAGNNPAALYVQVALLIGDLVEDDIQNVQVLIETQALEQLIQTLVLDKKLTAEKHARLIKLVHSLMNQK